MPDIYVWNLKKVEFIEIVELWLLEGGEFVKRLGKGYILVVEDE